MAIKPILFSGPRVRAIIEGRKTQTRRVAKPQPHFRNVWQDESDGSWWQSGHGEAGDDALSPPYAVGQHLWVRETWVRGLAELGQRPVYYRADGDDDCTVWRPSIHMPRWANRITLTVREIRCQRLQEISEEDARAEGLRWESPTWGVDGLADSWHGEPRRAFRTLWDSINGKRPGCAWAENPWVWAVSFTAEMRNVDDVKGEAA